MTPVAAVADDLRTGTATEETNEYLRAIINVRGGGRPAGNTADDSARTAAAVFPGGT